jgi:hypothetical protein
MDIDFTRPGWRTALAAKEWVTGDELRSAAVNFEETAAAGDRFVELAERDGFPEFRVALNLILDALRPETAKLREDAIRVDHGAKVHWAGEPTLRSH